MSLVVTGTLLVTVTLTVAVTRIVYVILIVTVTLVVALIVIVVVTRIVAVTLIVTVTLIVIVIAIATVILIVARIARLLLLSVVGTYCYQNQNEQLWGFSGIVICLSLHRLQDLVATPGRSPTPPNLLSVRPLLRFAPALLTGWPGARA